MNTKYITFVIDKNIKSKPRRTRHYKPEKGNSTHKLFRTPKVRKPQLWSYLCINTKYITFVIKISNQNLDEPDTMNPKREIRLTFLVGILGETMTS